MYYLTPIASAVIIRICTNCLSVSFMNSQATIRGQINKYIKRNIQEN